jgi:hypothetical protein
VGMVLILFSDKLSINKVDLKDFLIEKISKINYYFQNSVSIFYFCFLF